MFKADGSTSPAPPRQERSRAKLERILAATEELLASELFEDVSMGAIAARAGVSVGTIYTRFPSKEALLPALFERHDASVAGVVRELLEGLARAKGLRARLRRVVAFALEYHRSRRGLLRALTVYVRAHPESVLAETLRRRQAQYRAVAEAVAGDGRELGGRTAARIDDVEFVLGVINSVCREQVLFDDVTPLRGRPSSPRAMERRLVDMALRTLTAR